MSSRLLSAVDIPFSSPADGGAQAATREFRRIDEGCYVFSLLELGVEFRVDYLRRERFELFGELLVRCDLPGARTVGSDNTLNCGVLNFSNSRARAERAKLLADLSKAPELDWPRLLEECSHRLMSADREGQPATLLHTMPRGVADEGFDVDGLKLLQRHPVILFGDGGSTKSYLGLYIAGRLAQRGVRVGMFDWELAGEDHRDRLERLFGPDMPNVWYVRCDRPLLAETPRLRRLVREHGLQYAIYDSIAFACHDKPEAAESAAVYFRCGRQIASATPTFGSTHIAHINKSESGDQKPFGSVFWHNSARATFYVQRAGESSDGRDVTIGLYNRKSNLSRLQAALGFRFTFDADRTAVARVSLADVQDLAEKLPLWQRIAHLLRTGPQTIVSIAEELDAKPETVSRVIRRSEMFTKLTNTPDGVHRVALVERRTA